jgi:glycosyltransferase involved in cell wall biosynthesis
VIIPALNEGPAIGKTVAGIPRAHVRDVIVVDNGKHRRHGRSRA